MRHGSRGRYRSALIAGSGVRQRHSTIAAVAALGAISFWAWWLQVGRSDDPHISPTTSPAPAWVPADGLPAAAALDAAGNRTARAALNPSRAMPETVSGTPAAESTSAELPRRDARIVDHFDELEARARRGERAAACRLGFDLLLCRERESMADSIRFFIDSGARNPGGTESSVTIVQELEGKLERAAMICDGLPSATRDDAWRHLARAANLGDARAAARFAGYPPFSLIDDGSDVHARRYHAANARRLLLQAFEAGNPEALFLIQRQSASDSAGLTGVRSVAPDALRAVAYAIVLAPISDPSNEAWYQRQIDEARSTWPPERFAQATAIADAYRRAHAQPSERIDFDGGVFRHYDGAHCDGEAVD